MKNGLGFLLIISSALQANAQFTEIHSDDFSDGDVSGYFQYNPIGAFLGQPFGAVSAVDGGIRITTPETPDPLLGPPRISIEYQAVPLRNFRTSVDVIDFDTSVPSTALIPGRTKDVGPGPGVVDGYLLALVADAPDQIGLGINRMDNEQITNLAGIPIPSFDLAKDYRLVFTGVGSRLTGQLFDLDDLSNPVAEASVTDATYAAGFTGFAAAGNVDLSTGMLFPGTRAATTFDNLSISVPEPSACSLIAVGALLLLPSRRKS